MHVRSGVQNLIEAFNALTEQTPIPSAESNEPILEFSTPLIFTVTMRWGAGGTTEVLEFSKAPAHAWNIAEVHLHVLDEKHVLAVVAWTTGAGYAWFERIDFGGGKIVSASGLCSSPQSTTEHTVSFQSNEEYCGAVLVIELP
jgi:hypothetical protein